MAKKDQVEAIERSIPKIFEVENKLKVDSKMLPAIEKWITGEDYKISIEVTQLASRELEDGTIESEFEIKKAK